MGDMENQCQIQNNGSMTWHGIGTKKKGKRMKNKPKESEYKFNDILLKPKWSFSLDASWGIIFNVLDAPNLFHRFMQFILLGIRWRRINEK